MVATWFGVFLVDAAQVVDTQRAPLDAGALAERARARREGQLTPEEIALLARRGSAEWGTRDRRLADHGLRLDFAAALLPAGLEPPDARVRWREALLAEAERALAAAWDPSVHVEEAVRAAADLDRVRNLVGERLGSWVARDAPEIDPGDHERAARHALGPTTGSRLGPADPELREARRQLAELYDSLGTVRAQLGAAVAAATPQRAPNLAALLGPELAARLLAHAGGLDRLARLPASTIQVLGAESAFFEHLRGRAPPPRHGLLFLHPAVQSAVRRDRGRLARTLAGKVAIAARLDHAGAPVDPALAASFQARRDRIRSEGAGPRGPGGRRGSGKPLDRAAGDR
ncbi:MAG TPA: hypothetical protein VEL82_04780 [Thermoplasmata archaeon]|nr:hypothetical protein [Thermoplasmata archaeon]